MPWIREYHTTPHAVAADLAALGYTLARRGRLAGWTTQWGPGEATVRVQHFPHVPSTGNLAGLAERLTAVGWAAAVVDGEDWVAVTAGTARPGPGAPGCCRTEEKTR